MHSISLRGYRRNSNAGVEQEMLMEEEWMNNLLDILGKVALEVMKEYKIDYE